MAAMSKANAKQHAKRKGYYVSNYGCKRTMEKLKAVVAIDRHHAFLKTPSPRIKTVILAAAK